MSGTGVSVAIGIGHAAGVLTAVFGSAVEDLEAEDIGLRNDLDTIGELVIQGLVVPEPGGGDVLEAGVDGGVEDSLLPGCRSRFVNKSLMTCICYCVKIRTH